MSRASEPIQYQGTRPADAAPPPGGTWSNDFLVCAMLGLAGVSLAIAAHTYWFTGALLLLLLVHLVWGVGLPGRPSFFTEMLLVVPFIPWFRYRAHTTFTDFMPVNLLFMAGFYSLALGMHHLLCARGGGSRLYAFTAAIIAMTLAGTSTQHPLYVPLLLVFLPILLLEMRRAQGLAVRRPSARQVVWYAAALATLAASTMGVQHVVAVELPEVNHWLTMRMVERMRIRVVGLSRQTRLGSIENLWQNGQDDDVVLRQFAEKPAEYLRAVAYGKYTSHVGMWETLEELREVRSKTPDVERMFFNLAKAGPGDPATPAQPPNTTGDPGPPPGGPAGMIYEEPEFADDFCLPMGVRQICAFGDMVKVSPALTVRSPLRMAAGGYGYYTPQPDLTPPPDEDLQVPDDLQEELTARAWEIVGRTPPATPPPESASDLEPDPEPDVAPVEAALKVKQYFQQHFTYRLGVVASGHQDPVMEFLNETHAGHCEYFASAATLLLRSLHIPARYVTGFVCDEESPAHTYGISRRKDAHAWVEMYVQGHGWQTFDPTPGDDRPPAVHLGTMDRLAERFAGWWQRIWSVIAYGGVAAVISLLWAQGVAVFRAIPTLVWLAVLVGGVLWTFRHRLRLRRSADLYRVRSPQARALQAKLRRAEKLLGRYGLPRPPSTPVGDYLRQAQALSAPPDLKRQALDLLAEYQATRFRRQAAP